MVVHENSFECFKSRAQGPGILNRSVVSCKECEIYFLFMGCRKETLVSWIREVLAHREKHKGKPV